MDGPTRHCLTFKIGDTFSHYGGKAIKVGDSSITQGYHMEMAENHYPYLVPHACTTDTPRPGDHARGLRT